jgi:pSer/pThr/pTyr-binding forkhead associated (FHA) protein
MSSDQTHPSAGNGATQPREGTYLESDEEVRQVLQSRRARLAARAKPGQPAAQDNAPLAIPVEEEVQAERPVLRPPIALLCILDDGKADGEWVRLRGDITVIGRNDGEVRIPHDGLISGQHAHLARQGGPDGHRWVLADLYSTNGTFVRVKTTVLRHDNEVIIGGGRYRFDAAGSAGPVDEPTSTQRQSTRPWGSGPVRALVPSFVEITPAGAVDRFSLTLPEYWIGRDARACAIARPDDVLASARHARLYRDAMGQWRLENNKSINGVWLRIAEPMPLGKACQFRLGEQRFLFQAM